MCIPIIIMTLLNKFLKRDYIKQVETTPNFILNKLCYYICHEKYFIKYLNLPFGISIYVLVKMIKSISIIYPVFNEEKRLRKTFLDIKNLKN